MLSDISWSKPLLSVSSPLSFPISSRKAGLDVLIVTSYHLFARSCVAGQNTASWPTLGVGITIKTLAPCKVNIRRKKYQKPHTVINHKCFNHGSSTQSVNSHSAIPYCKTNIHQKCIYVKSGYVVYKIKYISIPIENKAPWGLVDNVNLIFI